ncbi:MAG: hypothetical protein RL154_1318, partial [Pseudomonadota bacterium]
MTLHYDGSFESFLCLIYEVYYKKLRPTNIIKQEPKILLIDEIFQIEHNEENILKVLNSLKTKFKQCHLETILNTFMCDREEFELALLEFIIIGFKSQSELNNITNQSIFYIQNLQNKLFRAYHKMCGYLRFEEIEDGTLYAKIENKFNLTPLLGRHFLKRFNNQNYIIHDIKRKIAFVKNGNFANIHTVQSFDMPIFSPNEDKFKNLWKTFFESVAIKSR